MKFLKGAFLVSCLLAHSAMASDEECRVTFYMYKPVQTSYVDELVTLSFPASQKVLPLGDSLLCVEEKFGHKIAGFAFDGRVPTADSTWAQYHNKMVMALPKIMGGSTPLVAEDAAPTEAPTEAPLSH